MLSLINKILFAALILAFGITFFTRNNFKKVTELAPAVLKEPIQTATESEETIVFEKNGFKYELTPLYEYEMNGLIVKKTNYGWFTVQRSSQVFPVDLCMLWGSNLEKGIYQDKTLSFSQDARWCWYKWRGNLAFNSNEISNSHLVIYDKELEKKVRSFSIGDQVKITGKLVNVKATNTGKKDALNPEWFTWSSSTARTDTGGGACEVVYVENAEILKKANILSNYLHQISFYGLIIMVAANILYIFYRSLRTRPIRTGNL